MALTLEDLDHFESLALAATEGPWSVDPLSIGTRFNVDLPDGYSVAQALQVAGDQGNKQREANADFIAKMNPQTILAMIGQLRALMK